MGRVREVAAALAQQGYVTVDGETVSVTESGRRVAATLVTTQEEILNEFLKEWSPHDHPDVEALVAKFSARLVSEQWVSGRA
jgi:Mn-dependent DtxR family transcriptional regulator